MEFSQIADATLWIGKEMMEAGADSASVEEAMLSFAAANGFRNVGVLVLPKSVLITLNHGAGFDTKMKHIEDVNPNFEKLALLHRYATNPKSKDFDSFRASLVSLKQPFYHLSFLAVPLGCAAFGAILGAGAVGMVAVFLAAFIGYYIRSKIAKIGLSAMFVNLVCAYAATLSAFLFSKMLGVDNFSVVQAASTFFLIPGVQLINTFEDMLKGHYLNGAARGLRAVFLSFGIVFGITLAIVTQRSLAWIF